MDPTIINTNQGATPDPEGERLRSAAEKGDIEGFPAETEVPAPSAEDPGSRVPGSEEKVEEPPGATPDNPEADAESEPTRDEQGRFTKKDGSKSEPNEPSEKVDEGKRETPYSKAKKEGERRDRSWQALEAEKAQARQEIANERRLLEQERQRHEQQRAQRPAGEFSSQDYAKAANEFEVEAQKAFEAEDPEEAAKLRDLSIKATKAAQLAYQKESESHLFSRWEQDKRTVLDAHPEVIAADSPIAKEMWSLLNPESPQYQEDLRKMPNGFSACYAVAKLRLEAASASGLREELAKTKAELAKYRDLTALDADIPSGSPSPKKTFETMTTAEQGDYLRRASEGRGLVLT